MQTFLEKEEKMVTNRTSKFSGDQLFDYHIRIRGYLDEKWAEWFGNVEIELSENCETLITCQNIDQAELYRLLKKIRDLGLFLISVQLIFSEDNPSMEREDCS